MGRSAWLERLFPFLGWFPISPAYLRADLVAGITGALVLVPKAMAYAQLSGLPVHFGLYTALLPALIGALWGSSRQLATGPVAIVSLMTAAAVTPLAVPLTEDYVGLALLLTLMVGVIQFALGAARLGSIVNFVSHPVILGFMNAAAIIIALSQLDMLLGIPKERGESFLKDIWGMLRYLPQAHLPTLAMSAFALVLMLVLRRSALLSKLSVLIAVVITTVVSVVAAYDQKATARPEQISDGATRELLAEYMRVDREVADGVSRLAAMGSRLRAHEKAGDSRSAADLRHRVAVAEMDLAALQATNKARIERIHRLRFERTAAESGATVAIHLKAAVPPGAATDGREWRIKGVANGELRMLGGGEVVGSIPSGLPSFRVPAISFEAIGSLLSAALIIALVAFMESISMAKAMATKSRQKIDPNQELIGQGLSNLGGAFFQSYPACGSFTGSAINLQAGARTGFAMVFNGAFVAVTLLILTPYLYHLPKAVLGVIILLAVTNLVTPQALKHTWQASRSDGVVALVTFFTTLLVAPHLDRGIMVGAALAILLFLYRTMKPRVVVLGRHGDGTLRDARLHGLPVSRVVTPIRFDGRLYFANVAHFEDAVLNAVADNPGAPFVLIAGEGINEMDASGEEAVRRLVERLGESGVVVLFSGLKRQVIDVMDATGLRDTIGRERFFSNEEQAIGWIFSRPEHATVDDPLRESAVDAPRP